MRVRTGGDTCPSEVPRRSPSGARKANEVVGLDAPMRGASVAEWRSERTWVRVKVRAEGER